MLYVRMMLVKQLRMMLNHGRAKADRTPSEKSSLSNRRVGTEGVGAKSVGGLVLCLVRPHSFL